MDIRLFEKLRSISFHKSVQKNLIKVHKNVNLNSGWITVNSCPICKSTNKKLWLKKNGINIYTCLDCLTGYSGKKAKNLADVYDSKSQLNQYKIFYDSSVKLRQKIMGTDRINLIKKFKSKGKLLDFGCGNGWFLDLAKNYYKCFGYEINLNEKLKLKKKITFINNLTNLQKYKFDIITLFDVIEHLEDPAEIIDMCHKMLNKDGIILFFTPNCNSVGFYLMQEDQNLVIPPIHLTYFHKNTIKKLIKKKFKILYNETFGFDLADYFSYLRSKKKLKINLSIKKEIQKKQKIIDNKGLGNHLRIVLKKN
ncbi:class I SAM-dependent methyltransferase [Candidatus Pelagibacter sp. HIMB1542]|uniref:class I SAM-dependent methyltransferase n=1 Tax=Candidatus Pelagibacter sp. HIMB1542 TaxID=3413346 RepID=UPI003F83AD78